MLREVPELARGGGAALEGAARSAGQVATRRDKGRVQGPGC